MRLSRANRVDLNHIEIINALRKIPGVSARSTPLGDGFPDVIVGFNGMNWLFEIKKDAKANLKATQERFRQQWNGSVYRVESLGQIVRIITATMRE